MNFCNYYFHKYPLKNLVAPTHLCKPAPQFIMQKKKL